MKHIVKRNFFREGDIVTTEDNNNFIFINSNGFNKKILADIETLEQFEYLGVLKFAKGFDPGHIHISFN